MASMQSDSLTAGIFSIKGKVALVTGGSRGIGLMIARAFVEAGAVVYISSRKAEVCDEVARRLSELGTCVAIPADLATAEGRADLVQRFSAQQNHLDILVNNAGAAWGAPLDEYPDEGFDKVLNLNVKSVFCLTRDLLPFLKKADRNLGPARVINIGSVDGIRVPDIETYAYSASKAALHHMTRVLAPKLGPMGVTVNAVAPGPFESKMTDWLLDQFREQIEATCPLGRIGNPRDMAGIALFLASPASAYINGTVIPVDGGICIQ